MNLSEIRFVNNPPILFAEKIKVWRDHEGIWVLHKCFSTLDDNDIYHQWCECIRIRSFYRNKKTILQYTGRFLPEINQDDIGFFTDLDVPNFPHIEAQRNWPR